MNTFTTQVYANNNSTSNHLCFVYYFVCFFFCPPMDHIYDNNYLNMNRKCKLCYWRGPIVMNSKKIGKRLLFPLIDEISETKISFVWFKLMNRISLFSAIRHQPIEIYIFNQFYFHSESYTEVPNLKIANFFPKNISKFWWIDGAIDLRLFWNWIIIIVTWSLWIFFRSSWITYYFMIF